MSVAPSTADYWFIYLCSRFHFYFYFRERGMEGEREDEKHQCVRETSIGASWHPQLGSWPSIQAYALTGNHISNLLVCRPVLNPLSHTSQGQSTDLIIIQDNKYNTSILDNVWAGLPGASLYNCDSLNLAFSYLWCQPSACVTFSRASLHHSMVLEGKQSQCNHGAPGCCAVSNKIGYLSPRSVLHSSSIYKIRYSSWGND